MIDAISRQGELTTTHDEFTAFVIEVEPRLRRALAGAVGLDRARDATAEALAWAWQHWQRVAAMENPAGYLYRVSRSNARVRPPKRVRYLIVESSAMPDIEPGLVDALRSLPTRQRAVVWLVGGPIHLPRTQAIDAELERRVARWWGAD